MRGDLGIFLVGVVRRIAIKHKVGNAGSSGWVVCGLFLLSGGECW